LASTLSGRIECWEPHIAEYTVGVHDRVGTWPIPSILPRYQEPPSDKGQPTERSLCPGDLDCEIVNCKSITLEIEMSCITAESVSSTEMESASSRSSYLDPNCLHDDPESIAPLARASQATQRSRRRRHVAPTACASDYPATELEFMQAMDQYKQRSGRMFPTWSEILEVLVSLGYQKPTSDRTVQDVGSLTSQEGAL
jgi:hypothetical protein